MQVLGVFLMILADPAIEQVLTALLLTIPSVYVLRIVKLFQTPVVPALLLHVDRMGPVQRLEAAHDIGIINMGLFYCQLSAAFLCTGTISDMDSLIRECRLDFTV